MLIRPLPATEQEARDALMDLRQQHRETYVDLSAMLGEPDDYLAGWVRRGVPEVLPVEHKRDLARYFNVDPRALGVSLEEVEPSPAYVKLPLRERV